MNVLLSQRTTSAFPLSIGTSLAFESLMDGLQPAYDPLREIPERVRLSNYQEFWINVETLFRNILGSISSSDETNVMPGDIMSVLQEEVDLIKELVREHTHNQMRVVFYQNKHKFLEKKHPFAIIKRSATEKQHANERLKDVVCGGFFNHNRDREDVLQFTNELQPNKRIKALIITHQIYDLLFDSRFDELDLLESHTGVLKKKSLWYTKLKNGGNVAQMPFNACTLQVFGDNTTFGPQKANIRQTLIALAQTNNWHGSTTKDRMYLGFSTLADVSLSTMFKHMLGEI
jgi:hypothetical protein